MISVAAPIVPSASAATLTDWLDTGGHRVVGVGTSRDPNAKVTLLIVDRDGGLARVVKVPTTERAGRSVDREGRLLVEMRSRHLGALARTVPRAVDAVEVGAPGAALVLTGVPGVPMSRRYHAWRHTARADTVGRDLDAVGSWIAELHARTAQGSRVPLTFARSLPMLVKSQHPAAIDGVYGALEALCRRLSRERSLPSVVHGDLWFGNVLVEGDQVSGVIDWEAGTIRGDAVRDLARFAITYALYLDRHAWPGGRVPGHPGLRAGVWGSGIDYALFERGWFPDLIRRFLVQGLTRLGIDPERWRDVALAGAAEVAVTADHQGFAANHAALLARLLRRASDEDER
jgi:hypothetical protein